jgi:eukaryotic-like serine/threonine-protein kinase
MAQQEKLLYEFGPFILDAQEQVLLRSGRPVALTPKAFETLLALIQNSGRLLEKDELLNRVWPGTFVEESVLVQNIFTLRKVLGDTPDGHQYIETVPRRGYRFVGKVRQLRPGIEKGAEAGGESAQAVRPPASISSRVAWVLAAVIVLAGMATVALYFGPLIVRRPAPAQRLPDFSNISITWLTRTGKCALATLSPDGRYLVHVLGIVGEPQALWITQLSTSASVQIVPPGEDYFQSLTISHDGNWIYYLRGGILFRVPLLGGDSRELVVDVDSPVTLSPDDKKIAFVREDVSQGESALIMAKSDGTEETKLASRKLPDYFGTVAWSPDGKTLACTAANRAEKAITLVQVGIESRVEKPLASAKWFQTGWVTWFSDGTGLIVSGNMESLGPSQLWYIAYPGGEVQRITHDLDSYSDVSITADSKNIVAMQESINSKIWAVRWGDWSRARQITSGTRQDDRPCWTPDGRIAYESRTSGNEDLWIVDADGSHNKQLTSNSGLNYAPSVTRDGHTLAFVSDRSTTPNIWSMDINRGSAKQLTHGSNDQDPACSPDGRWVAYTSENSGKPTIWRVPIDGGTPEQVSETFSRRPAFSPDGKLIAAYYWNERGISPATLAILPSAGGKPLKSFDIPASVLGPVIADWAPDGRSLIYIDTVRGVSNLWSQPLDGRPARQVTKFQSDQLFSFDLSRDGRSIVFSRGAVTRDAIQISGFK